MHHVVQERALTVSEAMTAAKRALEGVCVRVVGEVSEFNDKPGYKAAYFTICDAGASMPCMMWRDAYVDSGVPLRCGVLVEMTGSFSAYVPKGRMQFMVRGLALAGEGMLRMQVAALANRLQAEGLMRPDRKRRLPEYPQRIAVVTSPRGKAVHDVIRTLRRRYPLAELLIAGVAVEGVGAAEAIVEGLRVAGASSPDVILLVRGGGSYEDLMPFNHEAVARAVVACPAPVVTGIGHEPDNSIADLVADVRASTPTAAAEAVAPSLEQMSARLEGGRRSLGRALLHTAQAAEHRVRIVAGRPIFSESAALLGSAWQRLDATRAALHRAIPGRLERDSQRLAYARDRLARVGPRVMERAEDRVGRAAARLHDLSPLSILGRGYAVCFAADGRSVVYSPDAVSIGERLRVRVRDGLIDCVVDEKRTEGLDGRTG